MYGRRPSQGYELACILGLGFALAVMAAMIIPYSIWYFRTLNKELKKNSGTERTPEKEK